MQVEQRLLSLLREYLPFGIAAPALLYFSPTHREDFGSFVADLSDVGIPLLKEHPFAPIQDDLVSQLDSALAAELVLNIPHDQYPRMEW